MTTGTIEDNDVRTTYQCDAGHELTLKGKFTMFVIEDLNKDYKEYNYCPYCFGEWAVKQWPFHIKKD